MEPTTDQDKESLYPNITSKETMKQHVAQYEELAGKVMEAHRSGRESFRTAVSMMTPEEQAGAYHHLHMTGGLGDLTGKSGSILDQIKGGTLGANMDMEKINVAIQLRLMMGEEALTHRSDMGYSAHEKVPPGKYVGDSPMLHKHVQMGAQSMKEGKKVFTKSHIKKIVREEVHAALSEGKANKGKK